MAQGAATTLHVSTLDTNVLPDANGGAEQAWQLEGGHYWEDCGVCEPAPNALDLARSTCLPRAVITGTAVIVYMC